jgi:hypothetical protein
LVDAVFAEVSGEVIFHPASVIDATTVAPVQPDVRRRNLRAYVGRGLLERCDAKANKLPWSTVFRSPKLEPFPISYA